jgi:hypothetical protein
MAAQHNYALTHPRRLTAVGQLNLQHQVALPQAAIAWYGVGGLS